MPAGAWTSTILRMTDSDAPLTTPAAVLAHVTELVGPALRRQCWLLFTDSDSRPLPIVVPIDGLPVDPDPHEIARFLEALGEIVETAGARGIIVAWERPGGPDVAMQESDWMVALDKSGLPIVAQLLASDDGVRLLDPGFDALVAA